jgi:hypothetical protein
MGDYYNKSLKEFMEGFDEYLNRLIINEKALLPSDDDGGEYRSLIRIKNVEIQLSGINDTDSDLYRQFLTDLKTLKMNLSKVENRILDKLYAIRWDDDLSRSAMKRHMILDYVLYSPKKSSDYAQFLFWYNGEPKNASKEFFEYHSATAKIYINGSDVVVGDVSL